MDTEAFLRDHERVNLAFALFAVNLKVEALGEDGLHQRHIEIFRFRLVGRKLRQDVVASGLRPLRDVEDILLIESIGQP